MELALEAQEVMIPFGPHKNLKLAEVFRSHVRGVQKKSKSPWKLQKLTEKIQ